MQGLSLTNIVVALIAVVGTWLTVRGQEKRGSQQIMSQTQIKFYGDLIERLAVLEADLTKRQLDLERAAQELSDARSRIVTLETDLRLTNDRLDRVLSWVDAQPEISFPSHI